MSMICAASNIKNQSIFNLKFFKAFAFVALVFMDVLLTWQCSWQDRNFSLCKEKGWLLQVSPVPEKVHIFSTFTTLNLTWQIWPQANTVCKYYLSVTWPARAISHYLEMSLQFSFSLDVHYCPMSAAILNELNGFMVTTYGMVCSEISDAIWWQEFSLPLQHQPTAVHKPLSRKH